MLNHHRYYRPAPVRQYSGSSYRKYRNPSPRHYPNHTTRRYPDYGNSYNSYLDSPHYHGYHRPINRHRKGGKSVDFQELDDRLRRLKQDSPVPNALDYDDDSYDSGASRRHSNRHPEKRHRNRDSGYHESYYPERREGEWEEEHYPDSEYEDHDDYHEKPYYSEEDVDRGLDRHEEKKDASRRPPPVREILIGLASDILGEFSKHSRSEHKASPPYLDKDERIRTLTPSPATMSEDERGSGVRIDRVGNTGEAVERENRFGYGKSGKGKYKHVKGSREMERNRSAGDYGDQRGENNSPPPLQPEFKQRNGEIIDNSRWNIYSKSPYTPNTDRLQNVDPPTSEMVKPKDMFAQYGYNQIPAEVWIEDVTKRPPSPSPETSPTSRATDSTLHQQEESRDFSRRNKGSKGHHKKKKHAKHGSSRRNYHGSLSASENEMENDNKEEDTDDDEPYSLIYTPRNTYSCPTCSGSDTEASNRHRNHHRHRSKRSQRDTNHRSKQTHRHRSHSDSDSPTSNPSRSPYLSSSNRNTRRDIQKYPDVPPDTVERLEHKPFHQQVLPLLETTLEIIESLNDTVSLVTGGRRRHGLIGTLAPFLGERHRRRKRRGRGGDSEFGVLRAWAMVRTMRRVRKEIEKRRKEREREKEKAKGREERGMHLR